ncbi:MarR family winged helix-turn-helix transcriptional regulator [Sphingobacterium sp. Mn56C]|uniref:MarR family winged helix-turn-helix transcriptional regulator n=1 Tax=Sphingobacterium sp. Mn56C TaxID=3395261 RepID=UPI003BEE9706
MAIEKISGDELKLMNQICFPIYKFSKEITNQYRPLLETLDLTYPQYLVMMVLWEEAVQTVSQLGEKLALDSGTLTPLLKRMEQKDYVKRTRSAADERVVVISLTEGGQKLKEKALGLREKLIDNLHVNVEELMELKTLIDKILNKNKI